MLTKKKLLPEDDKEAAKLLESLGGHSEVLEAINLCSCDINRLCCCGITELDGIQGQPALSTILKAARERAGYFIFSSNESSDGFESGQAMVDIIKKFRLGVVTEMESARNPNSSSTIKMWVWTPDQAALRTFAARVRRAAAKTVTQ